MLLKKLCCILCCIAILCLTATTGFASGWFNGADRNGSISFDFNTEQVSVQGGSFELRMIACWDDDTKSLQWCEGWEDCGLSLEDDGVFADSNAAATLLAYAEANEIPAHTMQVGADGTAKVVEVPLGLFLFSQSTPFEGCMPLLPCLISVPLEGEDGDWIFDVEAMPKVEPLVPESTEPSETMPPPPDLPPTGQVNWPIPLLILGGCFMILLGICVRKGNRHETNS